MNQEKILQDILGAIVYLTSKVAGMDKRFDGLESRLAAVEIRIDSLSDDVRDMKGIVYNLMARSIHRDEYEGQVRRIEALEAQKA